MYTARSSQTCHKWLLKGMKNCGHLTQVNYKKCTLGNLQGWFLNTGGLKDRFDYIWVHSLWPNNTFKLPMGYNKSINYISPTFYLLRSTSAKLRVDQVYHILLITQDLSLFKFISWVRLIFEGHLILRVPCLVFCKLKFHWLISAVLWTLAKLVNKSLAKLKGSTITTTTL